MCEKCRGIDERVAHYHRIAGAITDKLTLDRIAELILKLDADKAALHPAKQGRPGWRPLSWRRLWLSSPATPIFPFTMRRRRELVSFAKMPGAEATRGDRDPRRPPDGGGILE
jgi:hypothetical protein